MLISTNSVALPVSSLRGSRLRCLLLTHQPRKDVAKLLTALVQPFAVVDWNDCWMPRGFLQPEEAKLGEAHEFLSESQRRGLTEWWLAVPKNANTPNWDIVSTCKIAGERGLLLVEAKAHSAELSSARKPAGNGQNDERIRAALASASAGLNALLAGWRLTADSHYQLSNRFAWAWKIASFGAPVILLYLGFLNAGEMVDSGRPFGSSDEWLRCVHDHAAGVVPAGAWSEGLEIDGTPMRALIRAVELRWLPSGC